MSVLSEPDVILSGLSSENKPLVVISANTLSGTNVSLILRWDFRSLLSYFTGFCERAVSWHCLTTQQKAKRVLNRCLTSSGHPYPAAILLQVVRIDAMIE